jgi:DNA-binding transcriptional LysR family regulator
MDWDKLRIFHAAAEAGSFTHAGESLHLSQSAISRQVSALEKDLNVVLFHRHARGLVLTEQGELLHRTVADVMSKLQTARTMLADSSDKPQGDIRITAPIGLGTVWVTQRIREFLELYPQISVDLMLNDDQLDLAKRQADVAIWSREPEDQSLICRQLFTARVQAFASTAYVRRHGAPRNLAELDKHRIISYSGHPAGLSAITWIETAGREGKTPRDVLFKVNSVVAMKYAVHAGIGIGMIPDYLTEDESDLVTVLTEIEPPTMPIVFCYAEELKTSKRVQVLRDFLLSKARQMRY